MKSVLVSETGAIGRRAGGKGMVQDNTQLFKLFADNPDFRRWLTDAVFRLAYEATG